MLYDQKNILSAGVSVHLSVQKFLHAGAVKGLNVKIFFHYTLLLLLTSTVMQNASSRVTWTWKKYSWLMSGKEESVVKEDSNV